jgi:hypothetical protein
MVFGRFDLLFSDVYHIIPMYSNFGPGVSKIPAIRDPTNRPAVAALAIKIQAVSSHASVASAHRPAPSSLKIL